MGSAWAGGHVRGPGSQFDLHFHFAIVSDDDGRDGSYSMPAMVDDNAWINTAFCLRNDDVARSQAADAAGVGNETAIVHRLGSTSRGFPSSLLGGSCSTGAIWIPRKPAEPLFGFVDPAFLGDKFATAPRPCAPDENRGMLTSFLFSSKICSMPRAAGFDRREHDPHSLQPHMHPVPSLRLQFSDRSEPSRH